MMWCIYPGLDDYHPEIEKNLKSERLPAHSDQHNSFVKRHSYFGKMEPEEPIKDSIDSEFINRIKKMNQESTNKNTELTKKKKISKGATDDTMNYMECYPGAAEWTEALGDDSEEEVDFSKMDTGSRKTTLGRWDFVDEEQYHKYQSKREAMPKAAFQYGKKTSDGRKTRRTKNKDTNASTDKEWQKIQKIIEKRL
ncbi:hypothetical protein A3Q56_04219 [Intoshia linei]|uniref:Protein RED C-terminal domain-containing protein n=1 Tax=Intoshia linei TaxID=1819745 RepID=A0A177B1B2_9BILA|nr:hypothetical protein A3Q56_04219 [Intoshia linei]